MTAAHSSALLIAPRFFGYEEVIAAELNEQGVTTTFIDERPSNAPIARAILRQLPRVAHASIDRYYRGVVRELATKEFDLVLIIKGETVPRWFIEQLRELNPAARFVFYAYDSAQNSCHFLELLDCFDEAFTFDREDAAQHPRLTYYPLFYAPEYCANESQRPIQLSFVGTLHSGRHLLAQPIFLGFSDHQTRCFLYAPARWYFFILKYLTKRYADMRWREVSFTPMSRAQSAQLFRSSHAVLDIHHPGQSGLSPRTFEVLASGCILITTNRSIESEPFYDESRVVVIPSSPQDLDPEALASRVTSMPTPGRAPEGFDAYAVRTWIKRVAFGSSTTKGSRWLPL